MPPKYTNPHDTLASLADKTGKPVKANGELRIPCPAHGGEGNNLRCEVVNDVVLVDCKSHHCSQDAIIQGVLQRYGIDLSIPAQKPPDIKRWEYTNEKGETVTVCRKDRPGGKDFWNEPKGMRGPWLVRLFYPPGGEAENAPVVLCEGRKRQRP